ncbi:LuxR family transcriptional regulator [Mycobacterium sp. NPDC003449]
MTEKHLSARTTVLLACVEGSAWLWQTEPWETAAALPWLRATVTHLSALNDGVLYDGRDAGDSFVVAFERASDALSCALDLQLTSLDPFALCIGLHSFECADSAGRNEVVRLRDIARGGQTLVSGATQALAGDDLRAGAALMPLGVHTPGDGHGREPLFQLCHPGLDSHSRHFQQLSN